MVKNNRLTEKGVRTDLPGKQLMHDSPTTIMPITQSHRCQWAGLHFQHQCNHFQESYTNIMITLDFKLLQQLDNCFYFLLLFFKLNYTYTYYYALIILKEIHKVLPYFKLHVKRKMKNKTLSKPLLYKHSNRVY